MYFENGFACQIKLRNTGQYEQSYGPVRVSWRGHPENWRSNDLFLEINFAAMQSYAYFVIITLNSSLKFIKVGLKNLWTFEVGHGTKKVEKHWSRPSVIFL